jgi:hypothetical protein
MPQKLTPPRPCLHCGNAFGPAPADQRYCSRACFFRQRGANPLARFWSLVNKHSGLFWNGSECWMWIGGTDAGGYGSIQIDKRHWRAHRFAYHLAHGPIPDGLCVCHHCDRPGCVRDEHHFLGTNAENTQDRVEKGRTASGARHPLRLHPERRARGERHGRAKLTGEQVKAIRGRYAAGGISQRALAREYGVVKSIVGRIVRDQLWQQPR